jgi:streptogramin lyase
MFGVVAALICGLALVAGLFMLVAPTAGKNLPLADITAQEGELNPDGGAFEINIDQAGNLWISDFFVDEVWQVNPANGTFTIFQGMLSPSDARPDSGGHVWWGGGSDNQFGRLDPANGQATWWTLPDDVTLFGTQFDANGDFWVVSSFDTTLYRFNPTTSQLCTYQIPNNGSADYPLAHAGNIWLGDLVNGQLHKLNPLAGSYTSYKLPTDSTPEGLTIEEDGDIWWADPNLAQLARFEPDIASLTQYTVPVGLLPQMVTDLSSQIWYSEHGDGAIGRLDPTVALSTTSVLTATPSVATPSCNTISPSLNATLTITTGVMSFSNQTYSTIVDSDGWTVYQLPDGALPWGVVGEQDQVWFVDTGRQVLGRIPQSTAVSVTGCKLDDADGDIETTDDRTPVKDWAIDLTIDGQPQDIIQTTGVDGCTTWDNLDPGVSYGLIEHLPEGWRALTPISHEFGTAVSGASYSFTFINTQAGVDYKIFIPAIIK